MTKLFRHYKNKAYKYVGMARHSETLEEMVIYETRYPNDLGKTWVRPKDLFHSAVSLGNTSIPRFRPIPVEIREERGLNDATLKILTPLVERIFGRWNPQVQSRLANHPNVHILVAFIENEPVGFKIGYEVSPEVFYGWIGGVVPEFRDLGVASLLMTQQHAWCQAKGYAKIQTKTQNRFREMLILNLRRGFDVTGAQNDESGLKILMEKTLVDKSDGMKS